MVGQSPAIDIPISAQDYSPINLFRTKTFRFTNKVQLFFLSKSCITVSVFELYSKAGIALFALLHS